MLSIVKSPAPTADKFSERIDDIFAKISDGLLHRESLLGMAGELCAQSCVPSGLAAIVYALNGLHDDVPTLTLTSLRDTVNLLIERLRELEVGDAN